MIKKVTIRNFKLFQAESFDLEETIVLAGPNNSGKSTLLQAIATWNLALQRWREQKSRASAKKRKGAAITRGDFTVLPLKEFNLLWTDRSAAFGKEDPRGKQGSPRLIEIELSGSTHNMAEPSEKEWSLTMALRYQGPEMIYVYPIIESENQDLLPEGATRMNVVHVPCFSGIGVNETRYQKAYQDKLIGEGKPGDILRNLLFEIYEKDRERAWEELVELIQKLFGYKLLPPHFIGEITPGITCEYLSRTSRNKSLHLDIASAGSGFHQVLVLFSFFLARPSSVLLLDEPDAHLHVILQSDVYDALKDMARRKQCQLIVATHSEALIDASFPANIISFFHKPHPLVSESERDQVREALKRVPSTEIILAEQSGMVLYLEGETDYKILRGFAALLAHPAMEFFNHGFFHSNRGAHPREAKAHLFSLRSINPNLQGFMLLDRDNRNVPEREILTENMTIMRWARYEIENYLLIPEALKRFCASFGEGVDLLEAAYRSQAEDFIHRQFTPDAIAAPLEDKSFLVNVPSSKDLLPQLFNHIGVGLTKNDYYQIVSYLKPEEVHPEIIEKLDQINELYHQADKKGGGK